MKDRETSSQELLELYESLPDVGLALEVEPEVDPRTGKSLESIYGASQWRLIWRKFRRNKAALAGGIIILLYYLSAIFAPFLAPYGLTTRFTKYIYMPPQLIHFFDTHSDGSKLQPWVYDLQHEYDENLRRTYTADPEKKTRVLFFAQGEPY